MEDCKAECQTKFDEKIENTFSLIHRLEDGLRQSLTPNIPKVLEAKTPTSPQSSILNGMDEINKRLGELIERISI